MKKRILVISWFFPPVNSSEGLVTYKLLNNSNYYYDIYTQKNDIAWTYGNEDYLDINPNLNCIYSESSNINEYYVNAIEFFKKNMNKYDIVMTRSMPEESHKIGLEIKKINPKIKWIASFGDPIGNNPFIIKSLEYDNPYSLDKRYQVHMSIKNMISIKRIIKSYLYKKRYYNAYNIYVEQKNILENQIIMYADNIICNNEYQKKYMIEKNQIDFEKKVLVLPHSYDSSLYGKKASHKNKKIVFTYIGHLDDIRTPKLLFKAIKRLKELDNNLSERVEFNFYGDMSDSDKLYVLNNELLDLIKFNKPIKYIESLNIMQKSDWLIHIDANLFDIIDENIFFAAKLADYLGSGRNIMGITMLDGASADLLRINNALLVTYSIDDIFNYLYNIIYNNYSVKMNEEARKQYDAKKVAKDFDIFISKIDKK